MLILSAFIVDLQGKFGGLVEFIFVNHIILMVDPLLKLLGYEGPTVLRLRAYIHDVVHEDILFEYL